MTIKLAQQLVALGEQEPQLRPHLRQVLASLEDGFDLGIDLNDPASLEKFLSEGPTDEEMAIESARRTYKSYAKWANRDASRSEGKKWQAGTNLGVEAQKASRGKMLLPNYTAKVVLDLPLNDRTLRDLPDGYPISLEIIRPGFPFSYTMSLLDKRGYMVSQCAGEWEACAEKMMRRLLRV